MSKVKSLLKFKLRGEVPTEELVKAGLKVGKNFNKQDGCLIDYSHCWLISIGDNVTFAPRVQVLAHDASTKMHLGYTKIGRVIIGEKTFVGAGSIILPGVTIGKNVIIGAGSVVSRDIPDNSVAVGSPASVVDTTKNYINRQKIKMKDAPVYPAKGWTIGGGISEGNKQKMNEALKDKIGYVE
ncbi:DapH/DapD/GlmU-related protein [Bacillus sp. ISL-4]|uniref:acyltransferase n=1 Tax=Bacillus sp. ISL-4 TaxID=2819125 RepID=UPI0028681946|nr:DapH/DapD/GlmU-related protein [Bacillus sp. ISL-4]